MFVPQPYGVPDFVNGVAKGASWCKADRLLPARSPHQRATPTRRRDERDEVLLVGVFDELHIGLVFPMRDGVANKLRIEDRAVVEGSVATIQEWRFVTNA